MDIISQMIYFILILTSKKNGFHYKLLFFLNTYHVHNNKISIFNEIEKKLRDIQNVMCTLHVHMNLLTIQSFKSFNCDSHWYIFCSFVQINCINIIKQHVLNILKSKFDFYKSEHTALFDTPTKTYWFQYFKFFNILYILF